MANINNPFGARILNTLISAKFNEKTRNYVTVASDAIPIVPGDAVKLENNLAPDENGNYYPVCSRAGAGDKILGFVTGIKANKTFDLYRLPNTIRTIFVCVDPRQEIEIQYRGTFSVSNIGEEANLYIGTPNLILPKSGMELDGSTIGTGRQLKIIGVKETPLNEIGEYTVVICVISYGEFDSYTSTTSFWNDDGVSLYPKNIRNVNINAALILDPQASAPFTADGTIYYDNAAHEFKFRENGVWNNLNATGLWQRLTPPPNYLRPTNSGDSIVTWGGGLVGAYAIYNASELQPGYLLIKKIGTISADTSMIEVRNIGKAASMTNTSTSILFKQYAFDVTEYDEGRLLFGTEGNWTAVASTRNSYFKAQVVKNGAFVDGLSIASDQTVTVYGKLTVAGAIDPTALLLDPQTSAPFTTDGTIYYNSTSNKFEFRENGAWTDLSKTFTGLTDTFASYTTPGAFAIVNAGLTALEETTKLTFNDASGYLTIRQSTSTNGITVKSIASIAGSAAMIAIDTTDANDQSILRFYKSGAINWQVVSRNELNMPEDRLSFLNSSGDERLSIQQRGIILLQHDTSYTYALKVISVTGASTDASIVQIGTTDANDYAALEFTVGNNPKWTISNRGTYDAPNDRLAIFNDGNWEVLTVVQSGYVSINNSNPTVDAWLQVAEPRASGGDPLIRLYQNDSSEVVFHMTVPDTGAKATSTESFPVLFNGNLRYIRIWQ